MKAMVKMMVDPEVNGNEPSTTHSKRMTHAECYGAWYNAH